MAEIYLDEEQILKNFAAKLDDSVFSSLTDSFLEDAVLLDNGDGTTNIAIALSSDYFQRSASGEFDEVNQYLSELCINIENSDLRDQLINEFELDRDYIESEI